MKFRLRIRNLPEDRGLVEYVRRRARFALARFTPRVAVVTVTVGDENGLRGGVDKNCRVTARLQGGPAITVSCFDSEARAAVARAFLRLERAVARSVERRRARGAPRPLVSVLTGARVGEPAPEPVTIDAATTEHRRRSA